MFNHKRISITHCGKVFLNLEKRFDLSLILKHNLRDNPRYMAGEFLSEALQNIEDFKFTEV